MTVLSSASNRPISSPGYCNSGWEPLGISYRGWPVYVRTPDGQMAFEEEGARLVSLPDELRSRLWEALTAGSPN